MTVVVVLLGLVFGSFIAALSYRWPRGISIFDGRSFCDNCRKKVNWFDNIPVISYLKLRGKCRFCKTAISPRYLIIEVSTALSFVFVYEALKLCGSTNSFFVETSPLCTFLPLGYWGALFYILIISLVLIVVFIIDVEYMLIPDEAVILLLCLSFLGVVLKGQDVYAYVFSGFLLSLVLMFLHVITRGRGMGLGDVKLVIPLGVFLGIKYVLLFFTLSFVIGGFVGLVLMFTRAKKLRSRIAFGPFLITAFFLVLYFGGSIQSSLF